MCVCVCACACARKVLCTKSSNILYCYRFTQDCDVLTITGVTPEDEGTYMCRVQNHPDPQYEDISETLELEYCRKW